MGWGGGGGVGTNKGGRFDAFCSSDSSTSKQYFVIYIYIYLAKCVCFFKVCSDAMKRNVKLRVEVFYRLVADGKWGLTPYNHK